MLTRWEAFARFLGDGRICLKALADKLSQVEQWRLLTIREHTVEIAHEQLATQWLRYHSRMARTRAAWSPKEKFGSMSSASRSKPKPGCSLAPTWISTRLPASSDNRPRRRRPRSAATAPAGATHEIPLAGELPNQG